MKEKANIANVAKVARKSKVSNDGKKERPNRANWNEKQLTTILLEKYVDEVQKKPGIESGLDGKSWTRVFNNFNTATQHLKACIYDRQSLQSRITLLKKDFATWSAISENSGFGIEADGSRYTATNQCWDEYIKSHKEAAKFRYKPIADIELLTDAFSGKTATGKFAQTSAELSPDNGSQNNDDDEEGLDESLGSDCDKGDETTNRTVPAPPGSKGGKKIGTPKNPKNKMSEKGAAIEALEKISSALKTFADASAEKDVVVDYVANAIKKLGEWNGSLSEDRRMSIEEKLKMKLRFTTQTNEAKLFCMLTDDEEKAAYVGAILMIDQA